MTSWQDKDADMSSVTFVRRVRSDMRMYFIMDKEHLHLDTI